MFEISCDDIESVKGILYDCNVVYSFGKSYEDDKLRNSIEKALDGNWSFIEHDQALIIFFSRLCISNKEDKLHLEDIDKFSERVINECKENHHLIDFMDSDEEKNDEKHIILFEVEETFKNFLSSNKADKNKKIDQINELRKKIKDNVTDVLDKKFYLRNVQYVNYAVRKLTSNDTKVSIKVKDIFNAIENKIDISPNITLYNYNFVANVDEIVNNLYGKLGNSLFSKNVRYEIDGTSTKGVTKSIKDTYKNHPEFFFFKNNGISLYVKDRSKIDVDLNKDEIVIDIDDENTVSVINGAQTISAVAKSIVEEDREENEKNKRKDEEDKEESEENKRKGEEDKEESKRKDEEDKEENEENKRKDGENKNEEACVLLRIFTYVDERKNNQDVEEDKNKGKDKEKIDEVTIALNQQKAINPEDIAMLSTFVNKVNNYEGNYKENYKFSLAKRGDVSASVANHKYLLKDFAQKVVAVIGRDPGRARSNPSSLLKLKDGELNTKFFDYDEKEDIFEKYKPVNLAFSIWDKINKDDFWKKSDVLVKNDKYLNLFSIFGKNGRYLVLSILVNSLFDSKNGVYEDGWRLLDDNEKGESVNKLLFEAVGLIYDKLYGLFDHLPNEQLDSNNFKAKKMNEMYDFVMEDKDLKEEIKKRLEGIIKK